MAWGSSAPKGVEDWVERLRQNDATLTSITVLKGRTFDHEAVVELCDALKGNETLRELYSSGHPMTPQTASFVAAMLKCNSSLTSLCVGDSSFGDESLTALAEGLSANTALQSLDLQGKGITSFGTSALAAALAHNTSLTSLVLADNSIGNVGLDELAAGLAHMQVLDLRNCNLTAAGTTRLATALLSHSLRKDRTGPGLQVLRLDGNDLGWEGAAGLAPLIGATDLRELRLARTGCGDLGVAAIAAALTDSAVHITLLDLSECGIGREGAEALANALAGGAWLQVLQLRGNAISDAGALALGEALALGPALRELDISKNELGPGAGEVVRGAGGLAKLSLAGAALGDEGAVHLADCLAAGQVTQLLELDLSGCRVGMPGLERLLDVFEAGAAPALEVLLLGSNPAAESEDLEVRLAVLGAARPDLDVAWRASG